MASIENAISILTSCYVDSRNYANDKKTLVRDNASKGVLDNTNEQVKDYARFYFRPKTPTYFYMEGYHQAGLRYNNDDSVNMPVPVLLLFDLEKLLQDENTVFNGIKASGNNFNPQKGVDAFGKLQFDMIYHDGAFPIESAREIMNYRQAEILYPTRYPIANSLSKIICRSNSEVITLENRLKAISPKVHDQWKDIIVKDETMFSLSGLRLSLGIIDKTNKDESVIASMFKILGQQEYYKFIDKYVSYSSELDNYPPLKVIFDVQFTNKAYHHQFIAHVDLNEPDIAKGEDKIPIGAEEMLLKIYFDNEENLIFSGKSLLKPQFKKFRISLDATETMPKFPKKNIKTQNTCTSERDEVSEPYYWKLVETDELPF